MLDRSGFKPLYVAAISALQEISTDGIGSAVLIASGLLSNEFFTQSVVFSTSRSWLAKIISWWRCASLCCLHRSNVRSLGLARIVACHVCEMRWKTAMSRELVWSKMSSSSAVILKTLSAAESWRIGFSSWNPGFVVLSEAEHSWGSARVDVIERCSTQPGNLMSHRVDRSWRSPLFLSLVTTTTTPWLVFQYLGHL